MSKLWSPRFVGVALFLQVALQPALATEIRLEPPSEAAWRLLGYRAWTLILEGEIDPSTPARVASAIARAGSEGVNVYLASPGGNVLAALRLGRLLREAGANTYVGTVAHKRDPRSDDVEGARSAPAECVSACALAFLGGVYRYVPEGSVLGVHRFSSPAGPTASDLDTGQVVAAAIAAYIREMEVDPALLDLMVRAEAAGMRELSREELRRLNVANDGRKRPVWSIEAVDGAQFLRGLQETVWGRGRANFVCLKGQIHFLSLYRSGRERAQQVAAENWYHSLFVGDQVLPAVPIRVAVMGEEIFAEIRVPPTVAIRLADAASIGHAMQTSRDAKLFVGYRVDVLHQARPMISSFIRNCYRGRD